MFDIHKAAHILYTATDARKEALYQLSDEGRAERLKKRILEHIKTASSRGLLNTEISMEDNRERNAPLDAMFEEFKKAGYKIRTEGCDFFYALMVSWE